MTLSQMRQLLAERNLRLTKSLGQNFLHDANQLRRIARLAELQNSDKVLEIGPGLGPLTELLVERARQVLAIEKDLRLVNLLEARLVGQASCLSDSTGGAQESFNKYPLAGTGRMPVLRIVHADALEYLRQQPQDWSQWKLVANLPYSVASPILVELARGSQGPERMVVTLQIEVAKRLMAQAGSPDYGLLTLLVQRDYIPQDWFKVPAGCFFPRPEVDSACVCLLRRPQPLLPAQLRDAFVRIVKRAFSQRRKMMLKLLKTDWEDSMIEHAFEHLALSMEARAESVTLEQFVRLTRYLSTESGSA
jgi:16S rRNA (adenine1518-N6/adenine1519-N6)-dimethyltransferase